jgi:phosphonopyruvate decarboxylase
MLLLIGWRGEPGVSDEPQHVKQGRITLDLLETMEIPCEVLPPEEAAAAEVIKRSYDRATGASAPAAIVARKELFSAAPAPEKAAAIYTMSREGALKQVVDALDEDAVVLSTTGKLSRELYEHRKSSGSEQVDFITVGSMGHVSQIAIGLACGRPDHPIYCLDGDGSAIMHMGGMTVAGSSKLTNFKHIIFNNGVHDSVGGQSTRGYDIDFTAVARATNYRSVFYAETPEQLSDGIARLKQAPGPGLMEIRVKPGGRKDLGRPKETMAEIKCRFTSRLR